MGIKKKINLIIYRFREKGLEILLVNDEKKSDTWEIPQSKMVDSKSSELIDNEDLIALDPIEKDNGSKEEAWAVEGDWHDIPSLKAMVYEDALHFKDKIKEMEEGTFLSIKEALKKVMPHQYKFLKELKDILFDRNSLKNM